MNEIVLEWTVRCLWTVQFFVMLNMFKVWFSAKMWCSEVFEAWSCCYMTRLVLSWNKQFDVHDLCSVLWFSTCSKFDFGPKCEVQKVQCSECLKLSTLAFIPRLEWDWDTYIRSSFLKLKFTLKKWTYTCVCSKYEGWMFLIPKTKNMTTALFHYSTNPSCTLCMKWQTPSHFLP